MQALQSVTVGASALVLTAVLGACASGGAATTPSPSAVPTATSSSAPPVSATPTASSGTEKEFGPQPGFEQLQFSNPTNIDHTWLPMKPGTQLTYDGETIEDGKKTRHRVIFTVTDLTKTIAGVPNVVLWDRDYSEGVLEEAELAFFAQADNGEIWHFGQYPEVYEEGKVVEAPAWIHGVKGAQAGLTMKADPKVGDPSYAQGWGPEVDWSDRAKIVKAGERTCVKAGCYDNVLVVDEYSADEPGAHQLKYYAQGVGNVRVGWSGNDPTKETLELTKVATLSPAALAKVRQAALKLEKSAYKNSKAVYGTTEPLTR